MDTPGRQYLAHSNSTASKPNDSKHINVAKVPTNAESSQISVASWVVVVVVGVVVVVVVVGVVVVVVVLVVVVGKYVSVTVASDDFLGVPPSLHRTVRL